jgi:hypothetical protein
MSDDLAKKIAKGALRIEWKDTESAARRVAEYAADRIEELQSRLHWVIQERDDTFLRMLQRAADAEANLAKAVEALEFYADGEWPQDYPGGVLYASGDDTPEFKTHLDYGDKARTTLAELKGEK